MGVSEWVNGEGAGSRVQDRQGKGFRLTESVLAEVDGSSAACGGAEATATAAGTRLSVYRLTGAVWSVSLCVINPDGIRPLRAQSLQHISWDVGDTVGDIRASARGTDSCGEEQQFSVRSIAIGLSC
jgi:hypothetical protein